MKEAKFKNEPITSNYVLINGKVRRFGYLQFWLSRSTHWFYRRICLCPNAEKEPERKITFAKSIWAIDLRTKSYSILKGMNAEFMCIVVVVAVVVFCSLDLMVFRIVSRCKWFVFGHKIRKWSHYCLVSTAKQINRDNLDWRNEYVCSVDVRSEMRK